jgi:two-component system, cell cycle response regulator
MNYTKKNSLKAEILVVDDTPANLESLFKILGKNGYKIRPVTSGYAALEVVLVSPPDLILLDILMPDISGYEVCQYLKLNPKTKEIPVIFLSGLSEGLDKARAFQVGGADYITKPFHVQEVLARVNNQFMILCQKKQLQNEILQRQQTEEALRLQYQREQTLNRVIQTIRNSLELSDIFSTTVAAIGHLLEANWVGIMQYLPEEKIWQMVADYLPSHPASTGYGRERLPSKDLLSKRLKSLGVFYPDLTVKTLDDFYPDFSQCSKICLPIPIYSEHQVWGSLCIVRHRSVSWAETDLQLAEVVADQLAIAIQQSQLYQQLQQANKELERLANLDGLTQVANRRRFDQVVQQEWHKLQQKQLPLSLILCDLDAFKSYNDTYGHLAGDDCLRKVAGVITNCLKQSTDIVARYGGEEFAILLPNTDITEAVQLAEFIRLQVQQLELIDTDSGNKDYVTLSLGVSSLVPTQQKSPDELVRMADMALYQAKKQGRNCVIFSSSHP